MLLYIIRGHAVFLFTLFKTCKNILFAIPPQKGYKLEMSTTVINKMLEGQSY